MKHALTILALASLFVGCASFPTQVYHAETLAADTAHGAVATWNHYYTAATNGATPQATAKLTAQCTQVYDASKKLGATLTVLDKVRLQYQDSQSSTNKTQVQMLLDAVTSQSAGIVELVKTFTQAN